MALFPKKREFFEVKQTSGAAIGNLSPTSTIPCAFRIERQERRLEHFVLHFNITIATPTSTAGRDALEGLIRELRVRISDAAGTDRLVVKANSATLINRHRFIQGRLGRYTQQCYGQKAAGTYNLFVPVYFRHPLMTELVGHRLSIPMDSAFVGSDLLCEFDIGPIGDIGLSAGTVTVNYCRIKPVMRNVPADVVYVPSQFLTNEVFGNTAAGEQTWTFPEDGILAGFQLEEFTSSTVRGAALSTGGTFGEFQFQYNGTERESWYTLLQEEENDNWVANYANADAGSLDVANPSFITDLDFMHDTDQGEAASPGSCYNLYIANAGQRARLVATNLVASAALKVSTYKFLSTNTAALIGA